MQLHTQTAPQVEELESDDKHKERPRSKHGSRPRRKKIIPMESQDSMIYCLQDDENLRTDKNENNNLPDVVQDIDCYNQSFNVTDTDDEQILVNVLKKKSSLPNGIIDGLCRTDTFTENNIHRKKFSLPNETSEGTRSIIDSKVEEFVNEVIYTISEFSQGSRADSVRKIRGIIKKTINSERDDSHNVIYIKRHEKPKNKVHFSDENITIEIPRAPMTYHTMVKELACYYCCFGFLFPNT